MDTVPQNFKNAKRPSAIWIILGLMVAAGVLVGLFMVGWTPREKHRKSLNEESRKASSAPPRVAVIKPQKSPPLNELNLPGEIQSARETTIYSRTSGYVKSWAVDMGDNVKAGQVIAVIDSPEIDMDLNRAHAAVEQSRASLAQAQAAVLQLKAQMVNSVASAELADLTLKRYKELRGTTAISEQSYSETETAAKVAHAVVDSNQAAVASGEAAVKTAESNVKVAQADVQRLEVLKSFETVTAPFDGTISQRMTETGSLITTGIGAPPLFKLSCSNPVRVYIDVPQAFVPAISLGQETIVRVREIPNVTFKGKISRTSRTVDTATRTMRAEILVPNPDGKLYMGMYGQVKLDVKNATPPLLLPGSALVVNAQGPQVALVREGVVHFQPIVIEGDYGSNFGVSSGVTENDNVIANPGERLKEGLAVTVVEPPKPQ